LTAACGLTRSPSESLRQIDIARIAHRAHIRAIGYLSGIERERGQPSVALDLEQGKVVAR
jgi:hypothetical protein